MSPLVLGWVLAIGVWVVADGVSSLYTYIGKDGQSWWKDHSLRILRMVVGIVLIILASRALGRYGS